MKSRFFWRIPGIALSAALLFSACAGSPSSNSSSESRSSTPASSVSSAPERSAPSRPQLPSIQIRNNTGYTIYYVYISPGDSESWGEDWLGDEVLSNGASVNITLNRSLSEVSVYDIRVKDAEGDTYTKWDVPLRANSRIEFTIKDFDVGDILTNNDQGDENMPTVMIVNNTGYTVWYVRVSQTASNKWGPDQLASDQALRSGNTFLCRLPYPLDVVNRYDIQMEDSDGDTYTKWDVLVNPNSRIVFTISDFDTD
jgi:hypothetical protein